MRLAFLAVTCVSLMAIAAPTAFAELDPVEKLFLDAPATAPFANNGEPSIAGQEPVSSLFGIEEEQPHVAAPADDQREPSGQAEPGLWSATTPDHGVSPQLGSMAASNTTPEPATTPVNAVPEPSAILLALAALVYFLLFGRRRRVA